VSWSEGLDAKNVAPFATINFVSLTEPDSAGDVSFLMEVIASWPMD
jgi:hypothetical protein